MLKFMKKTQRNSWDDQVTIQTPGLGGLPPLRESGFGALDSEARLQCYDNLATAAYAYAGVYFVAFWVSWAISSHIRGKTFTWPETHFTIAAAPSIAMALIVAMVVRKHRLPAESFTRIAQVFLVLSCWGIAQNHWGWQFVTGIESEFSGVHWIGVWIISFAAIVTLTPGMMLRAGVLSSLTIPAVMLASVLILGFPPGLRETGWVLTRDILLSTMTPVWICVGIAFIIAAWVFHLVKDASRARRLGSYQLEEKIGAGGMGEVWRAGHRMLARPAAIKLIREQGVAASSGASAHTVLRRFEREAQATAALTSPHTVQIYDFGITKEGIFYYVMELLRGLDLRTLIERTGPVSAPRALHFMQQACDSLADAHVHGMVHRDIKPGNLFTCRQGLRFDFLKVLDFGLVKELGWRHNAESQLTLQGIASGTPGFMAPEMATETRDIDGRADLYALGCVGFWLLTGEMVFTAESPVALLLKHVNETPPSLRATSEMEVPDVVESIIMDCLAKSPEARPRSAQELGQRLLEAQREVGEWTPTQAESWWQLHLAEFTEAPRLSPTSILMEAKTE